MWIKYLIIAISFYIFALLQNSFFVHFSLFGTVLNLVFAIFFTLIFFAGKNNFYQIAFISIIAGLFLDAFSYLRFGVSIMILLVIAFACKKIQGLLQEIKGNNFPFVYFLPLFLGAFLIYDLATGNFSFSINFLAEIIYNLFFASIIFYTYRKFFLPNENDRQLALFNK